MGKTIRATDSTDKRASKADKRRRAMIRAQKTAGLYFAPGGEIHSATALLAGATDNVYKR